MKTRMAILRALTLAALLAGSCDDQSAPPGKMNATRSTKSQTKQLSYDDRMTLLARQMQKRLYRYEDG